MKGDFSRIRFNPALNYTAVLEQQGRVRLDADANEASAIDAYLRDVTNVDVIGEFGCPEGDAGFAIDVAGDQITIGTGRFYVGGLLVENRTALTYDTQPWLIGPAHSGQQILQAVVQGKGSVTAHFFLQVWQRLVTALDDPCLAEAALGQADTTARLQTVWRVVVEMDQASTPQPGPNPTPRPIPLPPLPIKGQASAGIAQEEQAHLLLGGAGSASGAVAQLSSCCQGMYQGMRLLRTGGMGADVAQGNSTCGCSPVPSAGYQGLENQLYRVEVHEGGTLDQATFKWSRENGSVVTAVKAVSGPVVTVSGLGPDANLGYQAGQWVELTDDTYVFGDVPNQPGTLYQIQQIGPGPLQVTLAQAVTGIDVSRNARMRRWDQAGAGASAAGVKMAGRGIALENGIEVTFRQGNYMPGDYWTFAARTATGEIDWPPCGSDGNFYQPAQFVRVWEAPLACVHLRTATTGNFTVSTRARVVESRFVVDDCRLKFPPLTALTGEQTPPALHVTGVSWTNDQVITVDDFLQKGLFITLDQAPTCPWSGANFRVTLEAPQAIDMFTTAAGGGLKPPDGTDVFLRTVWTLDPPQGITVNGNNVVWLGLPATQGVQMYSTYWLDLTLNTLLTQAQTRGYARVRVRLEGESVYSGTGNSTLYLDGKSFGSTQTRPDGTSGIGLTLPSGEAARASDFEGWFYLAPTVLIGGVAIQGVINGAAQTISAVTVVVNARNQVTGLTTVLVAGQAPVAVSAVQAVVTLTYPPVEATTVSLSLTGNGVGTVVNIQGTATAAAGQASVTVPLSVVSNPGMDPTGKPVTDTVTLTASVATVVGNRSFSPAPTLAITGVPVPIQIN